MTNIIKPKPNETLRSAESLLDCPISCVDGEVGEVKDLLFDDHKWGMRYMVAGAGGWFSEKKVLISPAHLTCPDGALDDPKFPIKMTIEELKKSPLLESDAPVSQQYEVEYHRYHFVPAYWVGASLWGVAPLPRAYTPGDISEHDLNLTRIKESHLRSCSEIMGYKVSATVGEIGKVKDVILDINLWKVRYLVLDIGGWLRNRMVIVDTDWIEDFRYEDRSVLISLAMDQIKEAPVYDPDEPVNRSYEETLYNFYGKPNYWL